MSEQKSESIEKKPLSKFRRRLTISIIAGLAIFVVLSIYADIDKIGQAFAEFRWSYIPLILALTFLNYLLRFYKWHYFLSCICIEIKKKDSLAIFFSGLSMSVTPAKLGEVFKSYLLKRLHGIEVSRSVSVVFAERITDMFALLILSAIFFSTFQYGREVLSIIMAILLTLIAILQSKQLCLKLVKVLSTLPLVNRFSASLVFVCESAHTLFHLKNLIIATSISVLSWGFECLAMYFVLLGFSVNVSIPLSTFVFSFSLLVGAISMIPGGLGITEGSMAGLLILAGFSKGIAAGATLIIRFCTLWFGVTIGLITLFLLRKKIA